MTDVLGLPLEEAIGLLKGEGYTVICCEVRSKKGVPDGSDKRVIRVRTGNTADTVYLAYSVFKTDIALNEVTR